MLKRSKRQQQRVPAPAPQRGTEHGATPPLQDDDRALIMVDAVNAQRKQLPDPCIVHGDCREYATDTPSEHGENVIAAHKHWYYEQVDAPDDDSAYNYRNDNFDSAGYRADAPDGTPDPAPTGKRARQQPRRFVPGTKNVPGLFLDSSTGIEYHDPPGLGCTLELLRCSLWLGTATVFASILHMLQSAGPRLSWHMSRQQSA